MQEHACHEVPSGSQESRAALSPRLAELSQIIGLPAALSLVAERGGTRIYVPSSATSEHWLASVIGLNGLERLVAAYACDYLDIDRATTVERAARNHRIVTERRAGATVGALALKYKLTARQIANILARTSCR